MGRVCIKASLQCKYQRFPQVFRGDYCVHQAAGGVPRLINLVCDRALLAGYVQGSRLITQVMVKQAAREAPLGQDEAKLKSRIMQRILVNDAEVRNLAEPWLPDLHRLMHGKTPTLH